MWFRGTLSPKNRFVTGAEMNKSFFNFMVGGLRIKIMLTTVSHKPKPNPKYELEVFEYVAKWINQTKFY